jgi:DNA polymerase-3 subunit gamma/tau
VYILDEAHMLSKGAWNAFLKTLEEPPAHVLFILATTELEKVPETVQSRCQVFQLKKPTRVLLKKVVIDVAKKEGITIEPAAAELVALLADGSYRDALSVLQKVCASAVEKGITLSQAEEALGAPRRIQVESLLSAISLGSLSAALETLSKVTNESIDIQTYTTLVLEDMRSVLLFRHAPELRKEIEEEIGSEHFKGLMEIAQNKESKLTHHTLKVFLDAVDRLRFSPVPVLSLELALYELFT